MNVCQSCGSAELLEIDTYKRIWRLCHSCGDARPEQKQDYSLTHLPAPLMTKSANDEAEVYDYFVQQDHIDYSIGTAHDFIAQHIKPNNIDFSNARVLDISGGNGHFLMEIAKLGTKEVTLTEINQPAIDYARKAHGIDVHLYNFNSHDLSVEVPKRFDIVMARAAIMFCQDLGKFARETSAILEKGGLVIVNHSVIPTLGVMLRVQLDEFSYFVLRQPENVVGLFEKEGLILQSRADETDPSLYAYDHDKNRYWTFAKRRYERRAAPKLMAAEDAGKPPFTFRARDRRRSTMIFRKA